MLRALFMARSSNRRTEVFKTSYRGSIPRRANLFPRVLPLGRGQGLKILRTPTHVAVQLCYPRPMLYDNFIGIWAVKHNNQYVYMYIYVIEKSIKEVINHAY